MISKYIIDEIIILVAKEILVDQKNITLDLALTGINSNIESIDIVKIISGIEEKLEEAGLEGYDLFEKVFEVEEINLKDISDLIIKEIK